MTGHPHWCDAALCTVNATSDQRRLHRSLPTHVSAGRFGGGAWLEQEPAGPVEVAVALSWRSTMITGTVPATAAVQLGAALVRHGSVAGDGR